MNETKIIELAKQDFRPVEISKRFGLPYSRVYAQIIKAGLRGAGRGKPTGEHPEVTSMRGRAQKMKIDGKSYAQISESEGVTRQRIQQLFVNGRDGRSGPCNDCGRRKKLRRHHPDYHRLDLVVYLCNSCHIKRHPRPAPIREAIRIAYSPEKTIKQICQDASCSYGAAQGVLHDLGFKLIHGSTKLPIRKLNWRLPNVVLSNIWGIREVYISNRRLALLAGAACWDCRRYKGLPYPKELQELADAERQKKVSLGC